MVTLNTQTKEINCKIVYYGPGLGGKTTNLQIIHRKLPERNRSEMVSLATESDRTLFFDFLPLDLGSIKGYATKFQLYTVPGQVYYNETRKLVLRGVDGIVFVADSQKSVFNETIESFHNLQENLRIYNLNLQEIPHVIQYNKRDLPGLVSIEELNRAINPYNMPYFEGIASKGVGVFDSLKSIGKLVIDHFNNKMRQGDASSYRKKSDPVTASQQTAPSTTSIHTTLQPPAPKPDQTGSEWAPMRPRGVTGSQPIITPATKAPTASTQPIHAPASTSPPLPPKEAKGTSIDDSILKFIAKKKQDGTGPLPSLQEKPASKPEMNKLAIETPLQAAAPVLKPVVQPVAKPAEPIALEMGYQNAFVDAATAAPKVSNPRKEPQIESPTAEEPPVPKNEDDSPFIDLQPFRGV